MFVCLAFTLEANGLQNTCMARSIGTKSLYGGGKFVYNMNGNPNSPQIDKISFPNKYKFYNFYILIDFYLVFLMTVYPRSSRPNSRRMKPLRTGSHLSSKNLRNWSLRKKSGRMYVALHFLSIAPNFLYRERGPPKTLPSTHAYC
jgi:hypothetical protein